MGPAHGQGLEGVNADEVLAFVCPLCLVYGWILGMGCLTGDNIRVKSRRFGRSGQKGGQDEKWLDGRREAESNFWAPLRLNSILGLESCELSAPGILRLVFYGRLAHSLL